MLAHVEPETHSKKKGQEGESCPGFEGEALSSLKPSGSTGMDFIYSCSNVSISSTRRPMSLATASTGSGEVMSTPASFRTLME